MLTRSETYQYDRYMLENVIPLKMSAPLALKIIREIAQDTSRIVIIEHAKKRMLQRHITQDQIYKCLRTGNLTEGPAKMPRGGWRCTMRRILAGDEVTVVAEFDSRDRVLVVTVI